MWAIYRRCLIFLISFQELGNKQFAHPNDVVVLLLVRGATQTQSKAAQCQCCCSDVHELEQLFLTEFCSQLRRAM